MPTALVAEYSQVIREEAEALNITIPEYAQSLN